MERKTALITGASSGLGKEMGQLLASMGWDLIIVARRLEILEDLRTSWESTYRTKVTPVGADLSDAGSATRIYDETIRLGLHVDLLVNNAGSGVYGPFVETSLADEMAMLQLNINALVVLTKLYGQQMVRRGGGRIMNVASLLSFLPFPYYSVYAASKAFVLAFSDALQAELEDFGVTVTAVCPGPTDTAFNTPAMWNTNAYKANKPVPPHEVAKIAVGHALQGHGIKVVGKMNWLLAHLPGVTPRGIMRRIKKNLASQQS